MNGSARMAVLFADIAGSTSLYERLGDRDALARISACLRRLAAATAKTGGRVVKTIGDELMCVFDDAAAAIRAASDMQIEQQQAGDGLALRVGFHCGEVIARDGDVFGDSVNVAARVANLANAGQILATTASLERLPPYLRNGARAMGPISVRGKEQPMPLSEIIWQWADNMTMVDDSSHGQAGARARRINIQYESRTWEIDTLNASLGFGRDSGNDIVLNAPKASRHHGRIELRQSGFAVIDLSSNGTYLKPASAGEVLLRREEALIQGDGKIGAGESVATASVGVLTFHCA